MTEDDSKKLLREIHGILTSPKFGLKEIKKQVTDILQIVTEILNTIRPPVPLERVNIVVKPGDTLRFFSQVFGVTVDEILAINPGIVDPNLIFPGQIVSIPSDPPVGPDPTMTPAQHLVRASDTLFLIARQYGLTVDLLIAANPQITDPDEIFVNQVINLTITPPAPPAPPAGTIQVYVTTAETLTSIAQRTGVSLQAIILANPQIVDPNLIFVGQIINVPLI